MPHIQSAGLRIFYTWQGEESAPPLVLSHSLGVDHRMWDAQAGAFARHFRLLRYDTRGHGASDVPAGPSDIESLARDVLALLDALGVERAHFCGLSLGGMVGQWLGANAPERLRRLVLCSTSAYMGAPEVWNERIAAVRRSGMSAVADATVARWLTERFRRAHPEETARIREMLLACPPEGYASCCAAVRDMDLRPIVERISVETLLVCGTHDTGTPPDKARFIAERVRGARVVELDAAHLCNVEQPDAFNEAVLSFLTR